MPDFWSHCLSHFQTSLNAQQVNTWLKPLQVNIDDNEIRLTAPNQFVAQWVKDKFLGEVEQLAKAFFPEGHRVALVVGSTKAAVDKTTAPATIKDQAVPARLTPNEETRLNPNFTFARPDFRLENPR